MDSIAFDALTRFVSSPLPRRRQAKAAAAIVAATFPVSGHAVQASSAASTLVQTFYELVDAYQYADAYALVSATWQAQQSLATFTAGYADTAFVQCTIAGEQLVRGGTAAVSSAIASDPIESPRYE